MMQNMVSVMTSASCLTAFSRALMIVFKPGNEKKKMLNKKPLLKKKKEKQP